MLPKGLPTKYGMMNDAASWLSAEVTNWPSTTVAKNVARPLLVEGPVVVNARLDVVTSPAPADRLAGAAIYQRVNIPALTIASPGLSKQPFRPVDAQAPDDTLSI